ncbi:MaoC/PaaZ C-terminal domain-containing protein [Rhodococcus opacus]|uniref:MaoC/PaaZ C-terminal domain-containing protein n=1 Tax=Rhodococcus opacus TaxID=37919 RepID=A0AAX3YP35_RHOOP|nr:MaoC/PaaZ C-terminal domain-containing protein [Rhodococcus opacus]MCZ4587708.1 MaoC/PaaZ C-terminal domain-containing protein [Rhodococcus opacus]WLF51297.1 MaoC/PaaZ C-terminal domain-containing protein [Rhodococcus opacus]
MTDTTPRFDDLEVGAIVAKADLPVTRDDLVRYAGASGDFNPIHFNDAVAASAGLPGVLAHGMLTAALGLQVVADWVVDPTAVVSYETRFTRPVVVDQVEGAVLSISAKVARLDDEERTARIDVTVSAEDQKVLGKTQVHIKLSA